MVDAGDVDNPVPRELATLQPVFMQCVHDTRRRGSQPVSFSIEYDVMGDRFVAGKVLRASIRDPRFAACVEDAFLDLQPAVPTANGKHTYTFRLDSNGEVSPTPPREE